MKTFSELLALALALMSTAALAQEVSVDDARSRAIDFLANQSGGPRQARSQHQDKGLRLAYTSMSFGVTCCYVFNIGDGDGFVIAGGDAAARQILGYCDHGSFDYDAAPDVFKWWLGQYAEEIALAARIDAAELKQRKAARRARVAASDRLHISPLVKTKWGQGTPYNSVIPADPTSGSRYLTGCVATATAQVMKYWEHPRIGVGSHSYTWGGNTFSAVFDDAEYDWDNMLNRYTATDYTEAEARAVGELMYEVGVSLNMHYGTSASSATYERIPSALARYFGYDKSIRIAYLYSYSEEDWEDLVYGELLAGRPVLYEGYSIDSQTAHQFICDGYDAASGMFTINWGWNGSLDGCYQLTGDDALLTSNYGGFGLNHILLNVQPDRGDEVNTVILCYYPTAIRDAANVGFVNDCPYYHGSGNSTHNFSVTILNKSILTDAATFDLGVRAVDVETGISHDWLSLTSYSCPLNTFVRPYLPFDPYELDYNGVYTITPIYRVSGDPDAKWYELEPQPQPEPFDDLTLTVSGAIDPPHRDITFGIESEELEQYRTMQISHSRNYRGVPNYTSSNPAIATVDMNGVITGVACGEVNITAAGVAEGYYDATTTRFEIRVVETRRDDVTFSISRDILKPDQSVQITWTEGYDGVPELQNSDATVAEVSDDGTVVGLRTGTTVVTAIAPSTHLYNRAVTSFKVTVTDEDFILTEPAYFNYYNNPYEDDLTFNILIQNIGETEGSTSIFMVHRGDRITEVNTLTRSIGAGSFFKGQYNLSYLKDIFRPNVPDTLYLYRERIDGEYRSPFNEPYVAFTYRNRLTLDYTIGEAGFGTLILPFDYDLPEGTKVYACTGVDEAGVLTLAEEYKIMRNTPYIVEAAPNTTCQFVGPEAIDAIHPTFAEGALVGALAYDVPLNAGTDYLLQQQGQTVAFYQYQGTPSDDPTENDSEGNRLARQFRAFLRLKDSSGAPRLYLPGFSDDVPTGIEALDSSRFSPAGIYSISGLSPAGIYSISGTRLPSLQKGINVLILDDGSVQRVLVQ